MSQAQAITTAHAASYNPMLDFGSLTGIFDFPEPVRRTRRLYAAPQREKTGLSCFCRIALVLVGYKLAEQRPDVREAQAAYRVPGSVVPSFFVSQIPNQ